MNKYSFLDDYSEGCHPNILKALASTNMVQQTAYGNDEYSEQAKTQIREHFDKPDIPIYFVGGGTLANIIIIASALRPHEAIISADIGHIVVRETGAIEATGHKIITVPPVDGKVTPENIEIALANNAHYPHMAKPRLVYISNATEVGTVYTKSELQALSKLCKKNELLLLVDGARLGAALTADINDLSLNDMAEFADIFWIGGTKVGALMGEAIVIPNKKLAEDLSFHIKQRGALLAKGRLLGLQFSELFKDDLFFELSKHANLMANKLSVAISDCGYTLSAQTESNQVFPILPNNVIDKLQKKFDFYIWKKHDDQHSVLRLCTSWATDEAQIDDFIHSMNKWSSAEK
ncbi:threonine aldolase family protein [Enterovibrio norvegicus]|uniref:threonine aldolase family protein n=1 Tax=Enterovibrio norvegicus TaxID=188144 RepID=UPI000C862550|nr:aminotransferase class I/II-fold pyridoxal phosphate-dependent enzyme [Enterovibrio norvegicus]PMN68345.1 threonine aldolase [Enterovibrio norvegicus]